MFKLLARLLSRRIRLYESAQLAYDEYAHGIRLSLEGPTPEQAAAARSAPILLAAEQSYLEVIHLSKEEDAVQNTAAALYQVGLLYLLWSRLVDAKAKIEEALAIFESLPQGQSSIAYAISLCHFYLGRIARDTSDDSTMRHHLEAALEIDAVLCDNRRTGAAKKWLNRGDHP